jgi:predicted metal-dependent hydrolase
MDFIAYQYDVLNFQYLGEVECQRDPKRNVPLLPANSTKIKPPELQENEFIVFNIEKQKWIKKIRKHSPLKIDSSLEDALKLLKNPSKENIKDAIGILINLL